MVADEITALALRSTAAGDTAETTARVLSLALSERVPRCVVGVGLGMSVLETARAGLAAELPTHEYLRLVSTGKLPLDLRAIPPAHRNRWVEPLRGFLDPARYAESPVGRLLASQGLFYFGRHYVCDGGRIVACIGAWLPHGLDRFTDQEVTVLSTSATTLGPLLRLQALASLGAGYEMALMQDLERRGQAAFLLGPTGMLVATSRTGEALLTARPALREHLERLGAEPLGATSERTFPKLGVRVGLTVVPIAHREHRLATATPLTGDERAMLTTRQSELLDFVENGLNNREIGLAMGLSPATVKTMLQRLYQRTGTAGRMELVRWRRSGA